MIVNELTETNKYLPFTSGSALRLAWDGRVCGQHDDGLCRRPSSPAGLGEAGSEAAWEHSLHRQVPSRHIASTGHDSRRQSDSHQHRSAVNIGRKREPGLYLLTHVECRRLANYRRWTSVLRMGCDGEPDRASHRIRWRRDRQCHCEPWRGVSRSPLRVKGLCRVRGISNTRDSLNDFVITSAFPYMIFLILDK